MKDFMKYGLRNPVKISLQVKHIIYFKKEFFQGGERKYKGKLANSREIG